MMTATAAVPDKPPPPIDGMLCSILIPFNTPFNTIEFALVGVRCGDPYVLLGSSTNSIAPRDNSFRWKYVRLI